MLRFVVVTATLLLIVAVFWLFEGDLPAEAVDARYSNDASRFLVTSDGTRIHYRDEGNRGGLPLVLIHGSNASLHTWEPWVTELGDDYRLVTLDLPAHGLTGAVPDDDYSHRAMVAAVEAVTDHLALQSFVLGGNSMGGGITWRYALDHPERVSGMILVDASGLPSWRAERNAEESAGEDAETPMAFELLRSPAFRAVARYVDPQLLVAQGLRAAYNDSAVVDDELIERYRQLALREGTREAILQQFSQPWGASAGEPPDLSRLDQPTLILWGAQDTLIDVEVARRFHEVLPNSELVIFDDLGHVPMEEAPQRTAAAVRGFLETSVGD